MNTLHEGPQGGAAIQMTAGLVPGDAAAPTEKAAWAVRARSALAPVGTLALRAWLAQEFILAGWTKWQGGLTPPEWFAQLPFPGPLSWLPAQANWLSVMGLELLLGTALLLGAFTRWAAAGLMFITAVAIWTVHADLGWSGWNQIETEMGQGFKLPLMMMVMMTALIGQGGGRFSLDGAWRNGREATS